MSIKNLQKDIKKAEGYILSDGTCNLTHILPKCYDLIVAYNLRTDIKTEITKVFVNTLATTSKEKLLPTFENQYYSRIEIPDNKQEESGYIFNELIFNYFNNISPKGFYFGSSEGDGACFGWFKIEENEEY